MHMRERMRDDGACKHSTLKSTSLRQLLTLSVRREWNVRLSVAGRAVARETYLKLTSCPFKIQALLDRNSCCVVCENKSEECDGGGGRSSERQFAGPFSSAIGKRLIGLIGLRNLKHFFFLFLFCARAHERKSFDWRLNVCVAQSAKLCPAYRTLCLRSIS